jgi:threonine aldolase
VLVIGGEDDPVTPIEDQRDIAAALPAHLVEFHSFPGAGHGVDNDSEADFMTLVRRFVQGSKDEIRAIGDICRQLGLSLRSDGARFANACASLKYSPAEMTWRSGVDVLCFGGTKNGLALGEAVLFFDRSLSTDFAYRCKQAGQLASKMRFVAAPWVRTFEAGTWLTNARHANASALRFAHGIAGLAGVELIAPVEANAVVLSMACARRADRRPGQRCLRSRHVGSVL